jgi:hypothetical protein
MIILKFTEELIETEMQQHKTFILIVVEEQSFQDLG